MNTQPAFHVFGHSHLVALALTAVVAGWMVRRARRGARPVTAERVLAGGLLSTWPLSLAADIPAAAGMAVPVLPMHLCDWAAIVSALALLRRQVLMAELAWFWGMAGTFNGLLTPDLHVGFPSVRYVQFFLQHGGVVAAAIYLVWGARLTPRAGAARRAFAGLCGYAVAAALVNAATGANYGFLRAKPAAATLMDVMGPWPYYIGGLLVLAAVFFLVLDLPFRRHRRQGAEPETAGV